MPNFSKIIQIGHLVRDPDLKYTASGMAVANATIATNFGKGDKQEVCFIDVTFWDKTAENAAEYLHKGDAVLVEGRLKQDKWNDKDGNPRSKHLIIASSMTMLGKRADVQDGQQQQQNTTTEHMNAVGSETKDPWADTTGTDPEKPEKTPF